MSLPPVAKVDHLAGTEILVLDADHKVRAGMEQLFRDAGVVVTALADEGHARTLLHERFFAVVVVDLDTPSAGEGLTLVAEVKERSPASAVVVLTPRKAFEAAVRGFRSGASDIIPKAPEQVDYLRQRVLELAAEARVDLDRRKLLEETASVHDEFLRRMMETARKVLDLEERLGGRSSNSGSENLTTQVLVVDDDPNLFVSLKSQLEPQGEWAIRYAATGGEALDSLSSGQVQLALIKETLPDLPATMIVRTLGKSAPHTTVIVFAPGGSAQMYEGSRVIPLELGSPSQAAAKVVELRDAIRAKNRERRYVQAFRAQHYDFLRRYAELKHRLDAMLKSH